MKKQKPNPLFYFDEEEAQRACDFFPRFLCHTKGPMAGKPFDLEPWQIKVTRDIFGWKRADGSRRYRTVYIFIPRKNGKSSWGAGLATYLLSADGEEGAEVYSVAGDRKQAGIVFNIAKTMVQKSKALSKRLKCFKRTIVYSQTSSTYEVLSSDAPLQHGLNPHGVLFDELHVQPDRELADTMDTATGARRQPLIIYMTTAGHDKQTICGEVHDYAVKVSKGIIKDDSFLPVLYGADAEDDWTDPKTWKKANPNLGVSIPESYLSDKCNKAREVVAYENTFKRLHLNMWTQQTTKFLPIEKWDASGKAGGEFSENDLAGRPCYAGLDLASTTDVAALVYVFPFEDGSFKTVCRFFVPEQTIADRSKGQSDNYALWARMGLLFKTEGDVIDHRHIFKVIEEDSKKFNIKEIAFDRWGATQIIQEIIGLGLVVVPTGQGFVSLSAPTKELLRLVLSKKFHHGGNAVLRWMADNLEVKTDPAENVKPVKPKHNSPLKIDGIVAAVMALGRATISDGQSKSVYDDGRGFLIL